MVAAAREHWTGALSAKIRLSTAQGEEGNSGFGQVARGGGPRFLVVHGQARHAEIPAQGRPQLRSSARTGTLDSRHCERGHRDGRRVPLTPGFRGHSQSDDRRAAVREPWLFRRLHGESPAVPRLSPKNTISSRSACATSIWPRPCSRPRWAEGDLPACLFVLCRQRGLRAPPQVFAHQRAHARRHGASLNEYFGEVPQDKVSLGAKRPFTASHYLP